MYSSFGQSSYSQSSQGQSSQGQSSRYNNSNNYNYSGEITSSKRPQTYEYTTYNNRGGSPSRSRIVCGNCREYGHIYRKCKKPITSFGVIAFKKNLKSGKTEILLVQRKDTMGFVELIRGKYSAVDQDARQKQLMTLFSEITYSERKALRTQTFDQLWDKLWLNHESNCYKNEYSHAKSKYDMLDIQMYLESTESVYIDTEWGIPKGRLNFNETPRHCAKREFSEETGYLPSDIKEIAHPCLEEEFIGTNHKHYKHVYFIATSEPGIHTPTIDKTNISQIGEIKNVKWFSQDQALANIRSYDTEKKKIITEAFQVIAKFPVTDK